MTKTIPYLLFIIITTTIISTLFGSYIKKLENFVSYKSASCVCPPGYQYESMNQSGKRCIRANFPSLSEECTCPEKYVYDGPAAASTRCHQQ